MTPLEIFLGIAALILLIALITAASRMAGAARALAASEAQREALATDAARLTDSLSAKITELDAERRRAFDLANERTALVERLSAAAEQREQYEATLNENLENARAAFREAITASAGEAMNQSSKQLLELARAIFSKEQTEARTLLGEKVGPITDTLKKTEAKLGEIEKERVGAYERLATQMKQVGEFSESLRKETGNLVAALRKPHVRGFYGEVQLRRVAELAGMRGYCDFSEQESANAADGSRLRPDMIVRLPNDRCVVVDAKTNIEAYLEAIEAPNESERDRHLDRFARHVHEQAAALAKKGYWSEFDGAADFVVMFIPGDQFIDAALQRKPDLLELAWRDRIILASPSTLIGLLRAVHVGWREKRLSDQAEELKKLGAELHGRAAKVLEDFSRLGKRLDEAVGAYNEASASIDARLVPSLRRFEEGGARSEKPLIDPPKVDVTTRAIRSLPVANEPSL